MQTFPREQRMRIIAALSGADPRTVRRFFEKRGPQPRRDVVERIRIADRQLDLIERTEEVHHLPL